MEKNALIPDFTKPLDDLLMRYFGTTTMVNKSYFAEDTTHEKSHYERTRSNVNLQNGDFLTREDVDKMRDEFLETSDKKLRELERLKNLYARH